MKIYIYFLLALNLACAAPTPTDEKETAKELATAISENREMVQKEPVAIYDIPLDNDLNHWRFTVKLFETKKRFTYRVDMQYEEVTGSDEITFPNFGIQPQPQIKMGENKMECIIGFLDKKEAFRDYKKVLAGNGQLQIKKIKSYSVVQSKDNQ